MPKTASGGGSDVRPIPENMKEIFGLEYPNQTWESLTDNVRSSFKNRFGYLKKYHDSIKRLPKNYISSDELADIINVERKKIVSSDYSERFVNFLKDTLQRKEIYRGQPYASNKRYFFKSPTEAQKVKIQEFIKTLIPGVAYTQANTLKDQTIANIKILYRDYINSKKNWTLPEFTENLLKKMTSHQAGHATMRLAQILGGYKFNNMEKLKNIKINRKASKKIFDEMAKKPFGNPYFSSHRAISMDLIDEELGRKRGTFRKFKQDAVEILRKNKISPESFNINEIAGITANTSYTRGGAPFSQFIDIMDSRINQGAGAAAGFQGDLSSARKRIQEAEPSLKSKVLERQINIINNKAKKLEKEFKIQLPRIIPIGEIENAYGAERLQELKLKGLDIQGVSKKLGYSLKMPKGSITIEEFVKNPELQQKLIKAFKGPGGGGVFKIAAFLGALGVGGGILSPSKAEAKPPGMDDPMSPNFVDINEARFDDFTYEPAKQPLVKNVTYDKDRSILVTGPETRASPEDVLMMLAATENKQEQEESTLGDVVKDAAMIIGGATAAFAAPDALTTIKESRGAGRGALRTAGDVALKGFYRLGSPLATAGFTLPQVLDEDTTATDIVTDPLNYLGLTTMETFSKRAGAIAAPAAARASGIGSLLKNYRSLENVGEATPGKLNALFRLGLSPRVIAGASRFLGLPGLIASSAYSLYDYLSNRESE